jgi:hypothetical protein
MPDNMANEYDKGKNYHYQIPAGVYPESGASCRSGIRVIGKHKMMQWVGQHGQNIQGGENVYREIDIPEFENSGPGKVYNKPKNREGNDADHAYS